MKATLTREALRRFVSADDVSDEALDDMISDVSSTALTLAPCLDDDDLAEHHANAAVAVMRGAVLRWVEYDLGEAVTTQAGPYSETVASPERRRGDLLWPTEIRRLQEICKLHRQESRRQAFTLERLDGPQLDHADVCSIYFAPDQGCSCGAILTQHAALWEV